MIEHKIINQTQTLDQWLTKVSRPLVFTNGCFDILHRGHVAYLQQAAQMGKTLLVAVNSDQSVRMLAKGKNRPFNPLSDRMAILAALESVDAVVSFSTSTPLSLIKKIRPDYLVKGGDWVVEKIVGAREVISFGGKVCSIPFVSNHSTTMLIERVQKS